MTDFGFSPGPGVVRFERLLPGPIERVWAYLTESDKRARWFAGGELELRPGGHAEINFRHAQLSDVADPAPEKYAEMNATGFQSTGTIREVDPPRRLSFDWHETHGPATLVTFELSQEGDKVRLVLIHSDLPSRELMVDVSGGWHSHLAQLEDELAGRPRGPFWARHQELEGVYESRL
ncbi:SRPBCC family protein [Phenylobacterium sp.]|jgi:uncharacterized protein YndB with AHSA1/START domain|uniref:SRPBCC family protein n=1 Tax=Phenylobacterium sp. TaxID=1871053 RepID=UPI002F930AFC